jgi:hypothetical protein
MEENFDDIFNLDNESFVKEEKKGEDELLYKPYPEVGKDGVYKSLIRFIPNVSNPKKSKIHQFYVWLKDPSDGSNMKALCPSTVGKKSILKDIFWKLKNSPSAKDQDIAKAFSRKEDYYSLIQVVKDTNRPELEGKIMVFKFGRKVNDMIEQQIKPEYGTPSNPYDLFEGKNFGVHVRKVGEWNNYDLCSFVGDKMPLTIGEETLEKTTEGRSKVVEYLKTGPQDLEKYDYRDWNDEERTRIMKIIRNTIPDGRIVSDIIGTNPDSSTDNNSANTESFFNEASSNTTEKNKEATKVESTTNSGTEEKAEAPSLDDLYKDL